MLHVPAVAAVVVTFAQHVHDVHVGERRTDEAQQQPPLHMFVPQSKPLEHASPGEFRTHAPVPGVHALQPARTAAAEQHAPPAHKPEAHAVFEAQRAPGPVVLKQAAREEEPR